MRKHRMTPLRMIAILVGLLGVMVVSVFISISFYDFDEVDENFQKRSLVMRNGQEPPENEARLFSDPKFKIDFDELAFHESSMDADAVNQAMEKANQAIEDFELLVKAKIQQSKPSGQLGFIHQTFRIAAESPFMLHERQVEFEGIDQPFWVTSIFQEKFGRIIITPKLAFHEDSSFHVHNHFIYETWYSPINLFNELSPYSFGRGVNHHEMRLLKVYDVEGHENLLMLDYRLSRKLADNSLITSNLGRHSEVRYQLIVDKEKGFSWLHLKRIGELPRTWAYNTFSSEREEYAFAFDYKNIDGVWVPHRLRYQDDAGQITRDYAVVNVKHLKGAEPLKSKVQLMMTPRPQDTAGLNRRRWNTAPPGVGSVDPSQFQPITGRGIRPQNESPSSSLLGGLKILGASAVNPFQETPNAVPETPSQ
ncbi:hypothetical protein K8I31_20055 [bacterium]|nr:hypothetical protein [bacterium]